MNLLQYIRFNMAICLVLSIVFYSNAQQDTMQILEKHNLGKTINTTYDDITYHHG